MISRLKSLLAAPWPRTGTQAAPCRHDEHVIDSDDLVVLGEDLRNILTVLLGSGGECPDAWLRADRIAQRLTSGDTLSWRAPRPLDVDVVVTSFREIVALAVGDQIRVTFDLARTAKYVLAEPEEIERILLNLAVNSRQAMPDGGTLTIRTAAVKEVPPGLRLPYVRAKSYVRLTVADSSTGMPSATRHRVLGAESLRKEHGTQLTLAAVAHTVRLLGGALQIEADDGQGTRVVIDLPAVESADGDLASLIGAGGRR